MSPQNGGFRRAFLVVPDSYGREFRAVARSVIVFLSSKVYKKILNWSNIYYFYGVARAPDRPIKVMCISRSLINANDKISIQYS